MIAIWIATFLNPELAYYAPLKQVTLLLFFASWFASLVGIFYFFGARKSWPVIGCFLVSVIGAAFNVYGFLWAMNNI